jgi:hypothetical protein
MADRPLRVPAVTDERAPDPRFVDESLERSLDAWRDWQTLATSGTLGYARANDEPTITGTPHRSSHVPADVWTYNEVERAMSDLSKPLVAALRLDYLRADLTLEAKGALLGLSRRSFARRVDEAKRALVERIKAARRARRG